MPYISCHEGHVHSTYSQTPHVKQVKFIKYECNGKIPPYIELIPCDTKVNNNKEEKENFKPISYTLIFGIIISILIMYVCKKLTD